MVLLFSMLCFLLWFRLCSFVVFARFGARFLWISRVFGWWLCKFCIVRFVCVVFACFRTFLGLNYVLHCCVSAGMPVLVACSLFAVPFPFLLALLCVRFYGGISLSKHVPCAHS